LSTLIYIAKRYLLSIHKTNVVNLISFISIIGVVISTMAMIIVLSTFNGFDHIVKKMYQDVDPHIKIESVGDRFFSPDTVIDIIEKVNGIDHYSEVLEYRMLSSTNDKQLLLNIKGVDSNFVRINRITNYIVLGEYLNESTNSIHVGSGVFNALSLNLRDYDSPLQLTFFQNKKLGLLQEWYSTKSFYVNSVFSIQPEFDNKYALMNINVLRDFVGLKNQCSAIEIKISDNESQNEIKELLLNQLKSQYAIKTQSNQRPFLYKMIKTEKLVVYLIFSFIVLISLFSLISSIMVLLMEKQKDIYTFHAIGFSLTSIKSVFLLLGFGVVVVGVFIGTFLGLLICLIQQHYKWIKLGASNEFVINHYPIKIDFLDVAIIQCIVLILGLIVTYVITFSKSYYVSINKL